MPECLLGVGPQFRARGERVQLEPVKEGRATVGVWSECVCRTETRRVFGAGDGKVNMKEVLSAQSDLHALSRWIPDLETCPLMRPGQWRFPAGDAMRRAARQKRAMIQKERTAENTSGACCKERGGPAITRRSAQNEAEEGEDVQRIGR